MAARQPYSLRVHDLMTDLPLGSLPVSGVTWDDYIGKSGSMSATIPVTENAVAQRIMDIALPGRTMLYLERTNAFGSSTVAWGGILWTRTRQRDNRGRYTCELQAATIESYLRAHRLLLDDLSAAATDQFAIARQIVTYAQSISGGNLGIEMDATQLSGVLRDRSYSHYDLPYLGTLLDQLASVQGGFEWRVQVYRDDAGVHHKALRLGYPRLIVGSTDMMLDSPGPVTTYSLPEDGTLQANAWVSRGASVSTDLGAGSVPLMTSQLTTPADIAAGWPRLDGSSDYSSVEDLTVLQGHAVADLAARLRPVSVPAVAYTSTTIGQPQLGSYVRLRLQDTWPSDTRYRIVGMRVQVEERGRGESTELYLEAA